ncbi:phosphoribosylanthranilate isomerase [Roseisalinus antarcticus]|uniref:N-(5'-phosphoribosyl)anthranilate isomerase n=1 Tax=Roseisalinus antarcticus TaxID=254357 RepID=A0A1Y5RS46_9RHOB|nr:phosphoribosylanthranilate isomerase [Roseisalinus antarcticus]SLN24102.1 N-(5'-phosphoribosyl)anthranilate isomerase [Roseisalinus antarcticus]
MPADIRVKICGLRDAAMVDAAAAAGAAYVGFVFFAKSPRNVTIEAARDAALAAPPGVAKVALVVNPDDALLDEITGTVSLDMIQLHGSESPERVREVRARYGLPVMKAVGIQSAEDLPALDIYSKVADQLLVDAKPVAGGPLPGGNGVPFDWRLVSNRRWPVPWMLAGGLTPSNVADAIALTGVRQIDLSSGVESAPGVKDPVLIAEFIQAAQTAGRPRAAAPSLR